MTDELYATFASGFALARRWAIEQDYEALYLDYAGYEQVFTREPPELTTHTDEKGHRIATFSRPTIGTAWRKVDQHG